MSARVVNTLTLSTAPVTVFDASTDGGPISGFRVRCTNGSVRIWADPLVPYSTTLSGVLLSAGGTNTDWSPLSNIYGAFTSVVAKGGAASTAISFRPEMGTR